MICSHAYAGTALRIRHALRAEFSTGITCGAHANNGGAKHAAAIFRSHLQLSLPTEKSPCEASSSPRSSS